MERIDVAVIGAGLLGCFAARALNEYDIKITVFEAREDVCTGVSRANTGIIYTGYDTKPGTLKTRLCTEANAGFDRLCRELDVRFSRCGSLMISSGPRGDRVLREKYEQGRINGVPGLSLIEPDSVYSMEPHLGPGVTLGLYAPGTGTVDPWELGIAAYENACSNGALFKFSTEIRNIVRTNDGFILETDGGEYHARAVVNCAGLRADAVREMIQPPACRLYPNAADYLVLDDTVSGFIGHVIFQEPEEKGKGLTLVPTVDGNLLIGPTERDLESGREWASSAKGYEWLRRRCRDVVPEIPLDQTIRGFSAMRPNPFAVRYENGVWVKEDRSISNFTVLDEDGIISLIGIKTPGLTCAEGLGRYAAALVSKALGDPGKNARFSPERRAIPRVRDMDERTRAALVESDPAFGDIVCMCRNVTRGEVVRAIARGAVTVDGVKRRTGAVMGRCQGARCIQRIMELISAETGASMASVTKNGDMSPIIMEES